MKWLVVVEGGGVIKLFLVVFLTSFLAHMILTVLFFFDISFVLLPQISEGPEPMVTIPPNEYVLIKNPAGKRLDTMIGTFNTQFTSSQNPSKIVLNLPYPDISFSDNGEVTAQEDKQHQVGGMIILRLGGGGI